MCRAHATSNAIGSNHDLCRAEIAAYDGSPCGGVAGSRKQVFPEGGALATAG